MKAYFAVLLLVVGFVLLAAEAPANVGPEEGCAPDVAWFVEHDFYPKCVGWTYVAWQTYGKCLDEKGIMMTEAIDDCAGEVVPDGANDPPLGSEDGFTTYICPKNGMAITDRQFRVQCCLVNHALELSNKTYFQEEQSFKDCTPPST